VTHRRDIEGLRAIAVLAVVAYHAGVPGTAGGFVGVDVFFVISGFLITGLLLGERERTGRIDLVRFYGRRIRRLLPISTVVLAATAAVAVVVLPVTTLRSLGTDVIAAAGFSTNLVLAARGADYLAGDTDPSAIQHYWSLAVEEQFYLVWPGLIALVTVGAERVRRRLLPVIGTVLVASLWLSISLTDRTPTWAYFGLHTRAFELAIGAALAIGWHRVELVERRWRALLGWFGLTGIAVSVATMGRVDAFPGWAASIPVLSTAALIACGDGTPGGPGRLFHPAPVQWIGARSYSLYLWHWPALVLVPVWLERELGAVDTLATLVGVVLVAEIGYRLVEDPIRHSTRLAVRPAATFAVAAGLVAATVAAGVATRSYRPDIGTGVVAAAPEPAVVPTTTTLAPTPTATSTTITPNPSPAGTTTATASTTTTTTSVPLVDNRASGPLGAVVAALANPVLPDNVRPSVYDAYGDTNELYRNGCHQFMTAAVASGCVFGDVDGEQAIGLVGDSHAAQWFSAFDSIAAAQGLRLVVHTQGGCPVLDVLIWNNGADTNLTQCADWLDGVLADFAAEGVSVAIVSQYWGLLAADTRQPVPAATWERELPVLFDRLRAVGIEPVLLLDTPDPYSSTPSCASSNAGDLRRCEPGALRNTERAVREAAASVAAVADVGLIDPHVWLCTPDDGNSRCPVVVGDILVYRDSHHLSNTVVEWLTPVLDAAVTPWIAARTANP
jgi:peptidoglycan/LPS O-acetylase OafA/YrhL